MNQPLAPKPGCLDSLEISEIAGDLLTPAEARVRLAHVAGCDVCAGALRLAMHDLERELTPAERQSVAEHLTYLPARPPRIEPTRRRFHWSAAAAALLLVSAGSWYFATRPADVPALLAQASAEARPFDWRLPQAGHGRAQTQRGAESNAPAALLEAQAELAKRAAAGGRSAELLRFEAWSQLLDHQTDAAVRTLEEALKLAPTDLDVASLLGVAYAAQAEAGSPAGFGLAEAQFSRVLAGRPHDLAARFNRGLTYARLGQNQRAGDDWRVLLQAEPDGAWANEIRDRLKEAKLP
jgi:tetratricopeptide (TPR) repeat protein